MFAIWGVGGMGNLLTVECQRKWTGKGQVSHQVPNFEKKRKELEKREKANMSLHDYYGIHVMNEGLMLIGGYRLTLTFVSLYAMMLVMQQQYFGFNSTNTR